MPEKNEWEYRVQSFGSLVWEPKDQELTAKLNAWGEEGWEVISAYHISGSKVTVIARRPLNPNTRRRRSWPG